MNYDASSFARTRELRLRDHLIAHPPDNYPVLVHSNWKPHPGRSDLGEGDLIFASCSQSRYLVVEVKGLHPGTGHTARESRRRAHQKVQGQVQTYTDAWAKLHPYTDVVGCSYVGYGPHDAEFGDFVYPTAQAQSEQLRRIPRDVKAEEDTERVGVGAKVAVTVGVLGLGLACLIFGTESRDRQ
ncbi:hypothetical protein HKX48_000618 [Thoreauomyces humboldtii]|nr:hypothetical protein HKX48_000618 [Thoreauomyces humboldtii]